MKQQKPLTREQYLRKFSRAVRWRLPPQESEEAISDYRELIFQEERDPERLVEELGEPVQAAHLLTDVKTYRRWLKIFAVLAFGLFLQIRWVWTAWPAVRFWGWDWGVFGEGWRGVAVMVAGLLTSLYWFRRHGQKSGGAPKGLWLSCAAVLLFAAGTMILLWYVSSPSFLEYYRTVMEVAHRVPWQIKLLRELMMEGGVAYTLAALAGLVLARCYDRRWLALYSLALTAATLCVFVVFSLNSIDLTYAQAFEMQTYLFTRIIPIGAVGLVGTGVALC